ncbi:hypothetical protein Q5752_004062 [Cryptotrichosporon argae]
MFASSQPQTHAFQRTGLPTTSRKNVNKENAQLPSKTPSRAGPSGPIKMGLGGAPGTFTRTGLGAKTNERNMMRRADEDIEPKRLFQASGKGLPSSRSLASMPVLKPKTPGPSRTLPPSSSRHMLRTPAPARAPKPAPTPLPSAQRTRRRSRASVTLTPEAPTTPAAGRWEEEASLDSIAAEGVAAVGIDAVEEGDEAEDYEVEYMPPKPIPRDWEPAWTPPDLSATLEGMLSRPPLWTMHDNVPLEALPELRVEVEEVVMRS